MKGLKLRLIFSALSALCAASGAEPRMALAHDPLGLQEQYSGLPQNLADKLREFDAERTRSKVDAALATKGKSADERARILEEAGVIGAKASNFEQVYVRSALWPQGHKFKLCFFDGDTAARNHVVAQFRDVIAGTNLRIDPAVPDCPFIGAEIQVRFKTSGCFSYYGTDSLKVIAANKQKETMGLCGRSGPSWSLDDDGIIKHEIVHALGGAHEHQHPDSTCKDEFNLQAFRDRKYFSKDAAENEAAIKINIAVITQTISHRNLCVTGEDKASIVYYQLAPWMFHNGEKAKCLVTSRNNVLSPADRAFMQRLYPVAGSTAAADDMRKRACTP